MKKISKKRQAYLNRKNTKTLRKSRLEAGLRKSIFYRKKRYLKKILPDSQLRQIKKIKKKFQNRFYKKIQYKYPLLNIVINGEFGLEKNFDEFIHISSQFIDSQSTWVLFNLDNCSRIWPTAVTLLCSFKKWTEITARKGYSPTISSTEPKNQLVDAYLLHCGFYDYVKIKTNLSHIDTQVYDDKEIVKIKRENNQSEIVLREKAIRSILQQFSSLTEDQIENFDCNVLIEAFNNVTEHGRNYGDNGWWTLTQYHKKTGIISLSIADNGIGIKNSLLTGPQGNEIRKKIKNVNDDGEYISLALKENVSGALTASIRNEAGYIPLTKYYQRGSRRGNGLKRIREACRECGIIFNILSQKGFLHIDAEGEIKKLGTNNSRVFAGTLYHFVIPAKRLFMDMRNEEN